MLLRASLVAARIARPHASISLGAKSLATSVNRLRAAAPEHKPIVVVS